jgi:hypothetical protein
MTQPVSIWGVFPSSEGATKALNLLERYGFRQPQIAIEKTFRRALSSFDWEHALYVRLPEGIVTGFAAGTVIGGILGLIATKGSPLLLPMALFLLLGMILGTVLGALTGLIYARVEPWLNSNTSKEGAGEFAVGVQCDNLESEVQARTALEEAGARLVQ